MLHKMLMLLSVHVTRVLFLVLVGNSALTMWLLLELHALTLVACSYALMMKPIAFQIAVSLQPLHIRDYNNR